MTRAVGVDLGGTNVRAALVDVKAGVLAGPEVRRAVTDHAPEAVAALVEAAVAEADPVRERAGVGIGFAGMLRGWSGVVANAPNFGWREVDFRELLRRRLGPRTELYNDLNVIAFGEARWGGARGVRDVLFVYVGTGVGAGLICDGRLYIGASHLAGEFGHVKVIPGGRPCGCGQRGCLEAYVSGRNLQLRAREELQTRPSLAITLAGALEQVHAGHLDEAAARGDAYATQVMAQAGGLLGLAMANAVTTLNPASLVLGGGVWEKCAQLRSHTLAAFEATVNPPSREGVRITESLLGDAAGVLGAAALIAEGAGGS